MRFHCVPRGSWLVHTRLPVVTSRAEAWTIFVQFTAWKRGKEMCESVENFRGTPATCRAVDSSMTIKLSPVLATCLGESFVRLVTKRSTLTTFFFILAAPCGTLRLDSNAHLSSDTREMSCRYRQRPTRAHSFPVHAMPARNYGTFAKELASKLSQDTRVTSTPLRWENGCLGWEGVKGGWV